jgi:hypothetical protein
VRGGEGEMGWGKGKRNGKRIENRECKEEMTL